MEQREENQLGIASGLFERSKERLCEMSVFLRVVSW